ncbi:DUF2637 domain-containing protein [Nocardia brasiliensis]|uniref:DUF2637 domain-containing protein n=1 Tax=Nocardia brasiliensis TaxID=37326 RepID=UPI000DFB93A0|nr:DUF2637 domain-containing protein [Nocardia brasiliensis]SUB55080.1 Protein of uncharacterised function (DUF2637) [Nocardia brasiliensis]
MMAAGQQSAGMRWARWSAVVIITVIGAAAFVLSFAALRDLAILANTPKRWAWLFPVIVDGTIIQATVGALVLAKSRERRWFLWVLGVGALVSIAGNSLHAVAAGRILPWWAAALVAAIAPISLLVDTHGLAVLFRAAQQDSAPEPLVDAAPEPDPVPAPVAVGSAASPAKPSVPPRRKASIRRDPRKVAQAVAMYAEGKKFAEIGRALGVSAQTAANYAKSAPTPAVQQPAAAPAPVAAPVPVSAPVVAPVRPVPVRSVHPVRPVQQALPITVS